MNYDLKKLDEFLFAGTCFLEEMRLYREVTSHSISNFNIDIVLRKISGASASTQKISFFNAIEVKIGDIQSMQGLDIQIKDVRDRQLEGISYHLSDQEGDVFSFFFKSCIVE